MSDDILDFPIHLTELGASSYSIGLLGPDGFPCASSSFGFFDEIAFVPAALRSTAAFPPESTPDGRVIVSLGKKLYERIFSGEIAEAFAAARASGRKIGLSLRVSSRDLELLPWEMLHDGENFLFEDRKLLLSRLPSLPYKRELKPLSGAMSVLVILAESPAGEPCDLHAEEGFFREMLGEAEGKGTLTLDIVRAGTCRKIETVLSSSSCHIVHLVSRGAFRQSLGRSVLTVGAEDVEPQKLAAMLATACGFRMGVLSTPVTGGLKNTALFRLADYLTAEGAAGALIAGFPMAVQEWLDFFRTFYEGLSEGARLDAACTEARRVTFALPSLNAAMPVLFQGEPDALVPRKGRARSLTIQINKLRAEVQDKTGLDRALALGNLANLYRKQGRREEAVELYHRVARIFGEKESYYNQAVALNNCGTVLLAQKLYREAAEVLSPSLRLREEYAPIEEVVVSLNKLGYCHLKLGEIRKALHYYERSHEAAEKTGDKKALANCLYNLGTAYNKTGSLARAEEVLLKAAELQEELDDRPALADTLSYLGAIYIGEGDYPNAEAVFTNCLAIQRELGDTAGEGLTLNNLANAFQRQGLIDKAFDAYNEALSTFENTGNDQGTSGALHNLALIYLKKGEHPEAVFCALRARRIAEEKGFDRIGEVAEKMLDALDRELGRGRFRTLLSRAEDRLRKRNS
jgi:tetratricopeptide (TPR) repeat protein